MGIINPRAAMRTVGRRRLEANLRRHAELMAKYEAAGMSRDEASRKAYVEMHPIVIKSNKPAPNHIEQRKR